MLGQLRQRTRAGCWRAARGALSAERVRPPGHPPGGEVLLGRTQAAAAVVAVAVSQDAQQTEGDDRSYFQLKAYIGQLRTSGFDAIPQMVQLQRKVAFPLVTVVMTLLLFVFAEVTPKTYAIQQTDRVALRVAPLLVGLTRIFGPVARGLLRVANVVMPGRGLRPCCR